MSGSSQQPDRLAAQLQAAVDERIPASRPGGEPAWQVYAIPVPGAPVVGLCRDPRAGARLAPVAFAAAADPAVTSLLAERCYRESGGIAYFRQVVPTDTLHYLVIPPLPD